MEQVYVSYTIIHDTTINNLCTQVEEMLARGWRLIGGAFVKRDELTGRELICQAMAK